MTGCNNNKKETSSISRRYYIIILYWSVRLILIIKNSNQGVELLSAHSFAGPVGQKEGEEIFKNQQN